MPECAVCGSGDFDLFDGLYFCTECGTQSQDAREETAENEGEGTGASFIRELTVSKKAQKQAALAGSQEVLVTVSALEKFQQVLQKQADAIVGLGFDPSVKEALRLLWLHYLRHYGYAFTEDGDCSQLPTKSSQIRRRKRTRGEGNGSSSPQRGGRRQESVKTREREETENLYDVFPSDEHLFEDEEEEEEEQEPLTGEDLYLHRRSGRETRNPSYFSPKLTIALLYLAMLYAKQQFLLVDIVRWIREYKIPYHNLVSLFPRSFSSKKTDEKLMHVTCLLSADNIIVHARALAKNLPLPPLPSPSACATVEMLCERLKLPVCLQKLVQKSILVLHSPHFLDSFLGPRQDHLRRFDVECLAIILFVMRILYRLNDTSEILQCADEQSGLDPTTNALYVWGDWVQLYLQHSVHHNSGRIPLSSAEFLRMRDHRKYLDYCRQIFTTTRSPPLISETRAIYNPKVNMNMSDVFRRYNLKACMREEGKSEGVGGEGVGDEGVRGRCGESTETPMDTNPAFTPQLVSMAILLHNAKDYSPLPFLLHCSQLSDLQLSRSFLFLIGVGAEVVSTTPKELYKCIFHVEASWVRGHLQPLSKLRDLLTDVLSD